MNEVFMKNFFLFFFIGTITVLPQYTTPNTGAVWNMDSLAIHSGGVVTGNFPLYEVTNKIIVSMNDKVTILPGTTIQFINAVSGFEINGRFIASGTPSDSIYFTSPVADSTGWYTGFRFNSTAVDSECIISYSSIKYADYGMHCVDANPTFQNNYLFKCGRGAQLSTSDAKILNNVIERSYEYGILINLNSNPIIENNIIRFNNTQGTSAKNQVSIGIQGNNSPVIRNNVIRGGSSIPTGGISLWVAGSSNFSNMIVENNEIYDNSFGITVYVTSGTSNARIVNNKIYDNKINPNQQISGSGININGIPGNTPVISGNEIYGNWWGITIQNGTSVQAGPNPNIGNIENADTTDDGYNIIYNNIQGTTHYDLYNNCTNDIYAQNNDWRVYDSTAIDNNIFHKTDNSLHGLVKFIPFSLFIPVELTSFTAIAEGNDVYFNWTTSSESNNKGFEIQINENNEWLIIGFVEGKGTTTEITSYNFFHKNIPAGKHSYRLKQINQDGSYHIYETIEVEILQPLEFALFQNYPNPFNPSTVIELRIPENSTGAATLKVFDVLGKEVSVLLNGYITSGIHKFEFDGKNLAAGIYFYELRSGETYFIKKMMLIK
jgi:hypothetical protein